jgi:hypothetical protein
MIQRLKITLKTFIIPYTREVKVQNKALRHFQWLTSGYFGFSVGSSSPCVLCELYVSVVETSLATGL